jgi:SAM-dependent methyltransferase
MHGMATTIYDEVHYSNFPHAHTHPDRLATVATLHGLEPPDPFHGRVLEVGCGAGGNLMAMAAATPGLRALGVDLAAGRIAEGQATAAAIGLRNLTFRQGDVRELTDGHLGEFDYVVAHGVYGWMPPDASDALLATVAASLSPRGIAHVSYNAQPGGYFRRMLRDAGLWHARGIAEPLSRAEKAQELYRFLVQRRATLDDPYGALLERELPPLASGPLYRLVHDDLSEFWEPVWFAQFAAHAAHHGLDYVGEADLSDLRTASMPEDTEAEAWRLADGDRIAYETFTDLLTARHFRRSVLCHAGSEVTVTPAPERAARLHWAARPSANAPEAGLLAVAFTRLDREQARTVAFDELRAGISADAGALAEALLDGVRREFLIPHAGPLRAAAEPGPRPVASRLARWQAARGVELTSLAYTTVRMEEPAARRLVILLDGTRDRDAIRAALSEDAGVDLSAEDLEANLTELARLFLLEPGLSAVT